MADAVERGRLFRWDDFRLPLLPSEWGLFWNIFQLRLHTTPRTPRAAGTGRVYSQTIKDTACSSFPCSSFWLQLLTLDKRSLPSDGSGQTSHTLLLLIRGWRDFAREGPLKLWRQGLLSVSCRALHHRHRVEFISQTFKGNTVQFPGFLSLDSKSVSSQCCRILMKASWPTSNT